MKFFDEPWLEIAKLDLNDIVATSGDDPVQGYDDANEGTNETELPV